MSLVDATTNHSSVEDRSVKMAKSNFFILIFISTVVAFMDGYELRERSEMGTPTAEECMKPPMSKFGHECCRLPKERIWGDLRPSLNSCFKKIRQETRAMRQDMPNGGHERTPENFEPMTPTAFPGDSAPFPNTSPHTTTDNNWRKPHGKKPHLFHRHGNDSCFMECVFEDQGFLIEKMVNKAALLERLNKTLGQNELWRTAAIGAVETCYQQQMMAPSNNTCSSGSEEIFRCVFKQIFFNCPNWTQSDYCMSLKEFYQKCPDGPPPEITDNHSTSPAPPPSAEESTEVTASAETERYTEQE